MEDRKNVITKDRKNNYNGQNDRQKKGWIEKNYNDGWKEQQIEKRLIEGKVEDKELNDG